MEYNLLSIVVLIRVGTMESKGQEQLDLGLHTFRVKPALECAYQAAVRDAEGLKRHAYNKAIGWVEAIQTRVQSGVPVKQAAEDTFEAFFDASDLLKLTAPAKRFIAEYWDDNAMPIAEVIDARVQAARLSLGTHYSAPDPKCPYTDNPGWEERLRAESCAIGERRVFLR